MSFQTSFSIITSRVPTTYGFAGDPAYVICATGATLTATVWGTNVGTSTFLWEQIFGPAVTFTTPVNQVSVSFQKNILNPNSDVQMRFWINKGRGPSLEKYSDVWVYSTPTSSGAVNQLFGSNSNTITVNDDASDFPIAFGSLQIVPSMDLSTYALRWTYPGTPAAIVQVDIQQYVNGVWTTVGIVTSGLSYYQPVDPTQTYRVMITKQRSTKIGSATKLSEVVKFISAPAVYFSGGVYELSTGTAENSYTIGSNTIYNVSTMVRSLSVLAADGSIISTGTSGTASGNVTTINNFNTIVCSLTGIVPNDLPSTGTVGTQYGGVNRIYNYTVTTIGGVHIGG